MANTILVVDDEPDLVDNLALALETEDYEVLTAVDGLQALHILSNRSVDLILADIAMPNLNGYQLYERVRENSNWATIPFIFLSARTLDSDIRYGKELGVDDYLTKPIRVADLLATVRGKLRRARQLTTSISDSPPPAAASDSLTVGPLRIDRDQHRAWLNEAELKLSPKEFALLEFFLEQPGRVLTIQELVKVTHQLDTDHIDAGNLLRPVILSLRRKLKLSAGQVGSIENVRGVGYRLVASPL